MHFVNACSSKFSSKRQRTAALVVMAAIIVLAVVHTAVNSSNYPLKGKSAQLMKDLAPRIPPDSQSSHHVDVNQHNSSLWIEYNKYILVRKTAFYLNDTKPAIAINIMKYDRNRIHPRPQLKIVYNSSVHLCVPLRVWKRSGIYRHHFDLYHVAYVMKTVGNIYDAFPDDVMLADDKQCTRGLSSKIPMYKRPNKTLKQFGVCLHQPVFNMKDGQVFVDWIVLHQLLGVEIIYIYLETRLVSSSVINAIRPFVKSGLVELVDWSINIETRDYGQLGVIHDCLYRSKSTVKYLALYDLDEVIVPRIGLTWSDMFKDIQRYAGHSLDKYASMTFETYLWIKSKKRIQVDAAKMCSNMSLPVYLKRTAFELKKPVKHRMKLIIQPRLVDSSWIHYIMDNKQTSLHELHIPFQIATVHHYRESYQFNSKGPNKVVDDYNMEKYANSTVNLIRNIMC